MRNKTSGTTATSLLTPRRMDGLGFSVVNAKSRPGGYPERQKEGSDWGRSRMKPKKSFDRKQSSNGVSANFEKITPNAPIRHRIGQERPGLALSSTRSDYCESRDTAGTSPGQSFSKEITDTSVREEPSREVARNSDPSKEEKIPTKSGPAPGEIEGVAMARNSDPSKEEKIPAKSSPAPGEIEVVAMVDKEGTQFTRILIARKRKHLVNKKDAPKKINDTANESKGTTTKIAPFRRKNSLSEDAQTEVVAMVDKEGKKVTRILIGRKRDHLVIKKVAPKKINDIANESKGTTTKIAPFRRKNSLSEDAKNRQTPPESRIKMKRIMSFFRPQRVIRSSSGKNASKTRHVHANAVASYQEAGQCQEKIPARPTSEKGIGLVGLRTDDDVDRAGAIFEMENLVTRDLRLAARLKQQNSKNPKSKNHILSSLSMTRSGDGAEGNKGCRFQTSNDLQQQLKKQEDAPQENIGNNVKKDTIVYDIQKTYESAKHIGAEDDEGPRFRMLNDFPPQSTCRQENVPEEKHAMSIAPLEPWAVYVAQPPGTSSLEAPRASVATSSEMKPRSSNMQPWFSSSLTNFTTRVLVLALDGWKNLPGHGQEISLQNKSAFGAYKPNTLASTVNATFDMQHQLDGSITQDRETQKEFEKETKNDIFEDIRTSIETRDTNEEKKDPGGKPDVFADGSVEYRPPATAGTHNVTRAPEMNGFLTWPFGDSGWNRAPNPRPTRKTNEKLGAARRLGLVDDDFSSVGSHSSSSNWSREPDFHGMMTEAHSGDDFSDASTDLHDSIRGYECTTNDGFNQALDDSSYASNEVLKGYEYGNGEWEIVSVLDLPSLYNDETGTVNSQALQDFFDGTENASLDSRSDSGDSSALYIKDFLDGTGTASLDSRSDSGDSSACDDSVGGVEEAIAKFKLHASLLGVDEKDLLLAIQQGIIE